MQRSKMPRTARYGAPWNDEGSAWKSYLMRSAGAPATHERTHSACGSTHHASAAVAVHGACAERGALPDNDHLLWGSEWSGPPSQGTLQDVSGPQSQYEWRQLRGRPRTAFEVGCRSSPASLAQERHQHGPQTARDHTSALRDHDQLLEHLEQRKKHLRSDGDGVVLLPTSNRVRLGSARSHADQFSRIRPPMDKLPVAAGAQYFGRANQQWTSGTMRAASLVGTADDNRLSRLSAALSFAQGENYVVDASASQHHDHQPSRPPLAASGTTRGGVSWTRACSGESKENFADQAGRAKLARKTSIERAGSGVWSRVASTPWSWEPEGPSGSTEIEPDGVKRKGHIESITDAEGEVITRAEDAAAEPCGDTRQGHIEMGTDAEVEKNSRKEDAAGIADQGPNKNELALQNASKVHIPDVSKSVEDSAQVIRRTSEIHQGGADDFRIKWQREGRTGEKVFERYAIKGRVSVPFSTTKRQIIIIDDRKPLTHDMLGVSGNLPLPDKKLPSAVAVRERERAMRDLTEISNRFIRDRINGGPKFRRITALGANSRSIADLKHQLEGVEEAVCPTCAVEIEPGLQDSFSVQMLLDQQETWENDGCFGDAPCVTCSHNHTHTAHAILSEAADRKGKRARGAEQAGKRTTMSKTEQPAPRDEEKPQRRPDLHTRPESLSAWSTGDDESNAFLNMHGADKQQHEDGNASMYTEQMERKGHLEHPRDRQIGIATRQGPSERILKPHPPEMPKNRGTRASAGILDNAVPQEEQKAAVNRKQEDGRNEAIARPRSGVAAPLRGASGRGAAAILSRAATGLVESKRQEPGRHSGAPEDPSHPGPASLAEQIKSEVETQADELLRQKLSQLKDTEAPLRVEDEFPFDPNAEVVRHFGMEMRLASMGAIIDFIVGEIERRHGRTQPTVLELLRTPEKWEWTRKWVRAEGCAAALKFILQSNLGVPRGKKANRCRKATDAPNAEPTSVAAQDAATAQETEEEAIRPSTKLILMDPREASDHKIKPADQWASAKNKLKGAMTNLHWSRRDKKEAAIEKAAKEESVFQQITFYRLNPLGVRGPKDTMVV